MVSAREEEERISSPMDTVIWGIVLLERCRGERRRGNARGKIGDEHPSASSPWRLCPPGAGRFDFRVRRVRRRCIDLCNPNIHQPLAYSTNATASISSPISLRRLRPVPFRVIFPSSLPIPSFSEFPTYLEFGVALLNPPLTCPIPFPPAPIPLLLDPA